MENRASIVAVVVAHPTHGGESVALKKIVSAASERMAGKVKVMSVRRIESIVVRPRIGKLGIFGENVLTKGVAIAVLMTTANQTTLPIAIVHGKSVAMVLVNHRIPVVIHLVTSVRSVTHQETAYLLKLNMLAAMKKIALVR